MHAAITIRHDRLPSNGRVRNGHQNINIEITEFDFVFLYAYIYFFRYHSKIIWHRNVLFSTTPVADLLFKL